MTIGVQCWLPSSAVPLSQTQSVGKWESTCLQLNQRSSNGTNYKDDRLTSLNARFLETVKKAGMFVRYTELLKLLEDGVNGFICSSCLVAPIQYLFRYL